jgi:hypothetical protein
MSDGFTDITASTLEVIVRFPDQNQNWVEFPIPNSFLSPQAQQLLATPLSTQFQTFWSVTTDSSGQTQRDRAISTAKTEVATSVQSNTGQTAYNISANFPAAGRLFAAVTGNLVLQYRLPGEVITFNTTTPTIFGSYADPSFRLTFDMTIEIASPIPAMPCSFSPAASLIIENANISGDNLFGRLAQTVGDIINFFQDEPPIFQAAEGQIDGINGISLGSMGDTFGQLAAACTLAQAAGFLQFGVSIDQSAGALAFRLIHPLDDAPTFNDQTFPSLFHPVIGVSQLQIKAGDTLGVIGTYFTPPSTVSLVLTWNDTISGQIVRSEMQWGPQNGPFVPIDIPRQPYDSENVYQFSNLAPNQTYQFRVRDWDQTTCTPWSAWKLVATLSAAADQVLIWLDGDFSNPLGTTNVQSDGTFATNVIIPPTTTPGAHMLNAQLIGGDAAQPLQIQVLAPNATYPASIEIIDPNTQQAFHVAMEGSPFTVSGYGFVAGSVNLSVDSTSGVSIGQVTAGGDGKIPATTLQMPLGVIGQHQLIGWQMSGGSTTQASWSFFSQKIPQ